MRTRFATAKCPHCHVGGGVFQLVLKQPRDLRIPTGIKAHTEHLAPARGHFACDRVSMTAATTAHACNAPTRHVTRAAAVRGEQRPARRLHVHCRTCRKLEPDASNLRTASLRGNRTARHRPACPLHVLQRALFRCQPLLTPRSLPDGWPLPRLHARAGSAAARVRRRTTAACARGPPHPAKRPASICRMPDSSCDSNRQSSTRKSRPWGRWTRSTPCRLAVTILAARGRA
jgi:hypothetical protein